MPPSKKIRFGSVIAASVLLLGCASDSDDNPIADPDETTTTEEQSTTTTGDDTEDTTTTTEDDGGDDEIADGFQLVEGDGVSLAIPDSWTPVPLEEYIPGTDQMEDLIPDAPEGLISQVETIFQQGGVFMAFAPPEGEFSDNVNILELPASPSLDQIESQAAMGLEQVGGEPDEPERIELDSGEAVRLSYVLSMDAPQGKVTVQGVQYYIPVDGSTYVLTISALDPPGDIGDEMANSFRVG